MCVWRLRKHSAVIVCIELLAHIFLLLSEPSVTPCSFGRLVGFPMYGSLHTRTIPLMPGSLHASSRGSYEKCYAVTSALLQRDPYALQVGLARLGWAKLNAPASPKPRDLRRNCPVFSGADTNDSHVHTAGPATEPGGV